MFYLFSISRTVEIRDHNSLLLDTVQSCVETRDDESNKNFLIALDTICSRNEIIIAWEVSISLPIAHLFHDLTCDSATILMKKMNLLELTSFDNCGNFLMTILMKENVQHSGLPEKGWRETISQMKDSSERIFSCASILHLVYRWEQLYQ